MSRALPLAAALLIGAGLFVARTPGLAAEAVMKAPVPAVSVPATGTRETAIFAGGCFWGVQGVYSHVKGVISATSGYAGGKASTANYDTVSTGTTGHAESVRLVFDPRVVSYGDLLRIYFSVVADPTLLNAQGPDEGTQYRSALFPTSPAQDKVARAYIAQLGAAHLWSKPIVTAIEPARGFYPAEAHHQDFMARNPNYPYILINDRPKVDALKRIFPASYKG
jgi:peptide-methionine (S)-S-oxide reductase